MAESYERMTFTVPARLKRLLRKRRDVNWSGVVTRALEERLAALELADRVLAKSRLTMAEVDRIADEIDEAMAKRHGLVR